MKKKPTGPVGRRCPNLPSVKPGAPVAAPVAETPADVPVAAPVAPVTAPPAPEYVGTAHREEDEWTEEELKELEGGEG